MEQNKSVEEKKARLTLLIIQEALWFVVMVLEIIVLINKQIKLSEHMYFLVTLNAITMITILLNVYRYRKSK